MALHAVHQLVSSIVPHTQSLMHAAYNQQRISCFETSAGAVLEQAKRQKSWWCRSCRSA